MRVGVRAKVGAGAWVRVKVGVITSSRLLRSSSVFSTEVAIVLVRVRERERRKRAVYASCTRLTLMKSTPG